MSDHELAEALSRFARNSKLFSLLDADGLQKLGNCGALVHFDANNEVVRQGDVGDKFYLITHGSVRVLVEEAGGEVARLGPGTFFGEMGVLTNQPRSATVETLEESEMIAFEREPVLEILQSYPRVKEVIGTVGLQRSEENLDRQLSAGGDEGGLSALLEGADDDGADSMGLADLLEGPEDDIPDFAADSVSDEDDDDSEDVALEFDFGDDDERSDGNSNNS